MFEALLLLAVAAPAPMVQEAADPLAPAREGKIRCIEPDVAKHDCQSIVRYKFDQDGSFEAHVTGILERDPVVLIDYRMRGKVEGDAVCSILHGSDFMAGDLYRGGERLGEVAARDIRLRLQGRFTGMEGKKRCFIDQPSGSAIVSNVTINGLVEPSYRQNILWVSPADGYAIGD